MTEETVLEAKAACLAPRHRSTESTGGTQRFGLTQVQTDTVPSVRHRQRRREKQRRCANLPGSDRVR